LIIFLLSVFVISTNVGVYGATAGWIKNWYNVPLGLIASTFWFAVICMVSWYRRYQILDTHNNQRNIHDSQAKKSWLYYAGLIITFLVLPMLAIVTTINQAVNGTLTIHNAISSLIIPLFIALIMIGLFESMPLNSNTINSNILPNDLGNPVSGQHNNAIEKNDENKSNSDISEHKFNDENVSITPPSILSMPSNLPRYSLHDSCKRTQPR